MSAQGDKQKTSFKSMQEGMIPGLVRMNFLCQVQPQAKNNAHP